MFFSKSKKAQGATEYLVLLAVVLIVAMVAIALLGYFPGLAGDAKTSESDAYWRGAARPFEVLEHSQISTNSTFILVVVNVDASQWNMNNLTIAGSGQNATWTPATLSQGYFSAGEKKVLYVNFSSNCTSGSTYEYYANFTYSNSDNTVTDRQVGSKTLVGRCS